MATWNFDAAHTAVTFSARHMMVTTVHGRFAPPTGKLVFDPANPAASYVEATIDATTISTGVDQRDAHLKSADFLEVDKFPTITFKSTKIEKTGGNGLKITGDLTVHGVTKPVTLDAKVNKIGLFEIPGVVKAHTAGFDATTVIRRSDFGVTKFLPAVSDEIPVRITLDAKLARAQ